MAQNQVNSHQFFWGVINEFHKRDFPPRFTIFRPPDEYLQDSERSMSLEVVEEQLADGTYENNYWMFIRDVNEALDVLIEGFNNTTATYRKAMLFKKLFGIKMERFMKDNGYCCGQWYISKAKDITCSAGTEEEQCIIKDGENFFRFDDITYCEFHLNEKRNQDTNMILLSETRSIHRSQMVKYTFRRKLDESLVQCEDCKRFFHERCVLQIKFPTKEFYCANCRHPNDFRFNRLNVDMIPNTDFDVFIKEFMDENMYENFSSKFTVRMLNCGKNSFQVNYNIQKYCRGLPEMITYTGCTIFGFFKDNEGNDVCCLTLFAQLYGDDAPKANMKSAYISYIDSVKLYNGKDRTKIYHTLILGFFDYLRQNGFEKVFIWSCPPENGVDYVFPHKPQNQKMPDADILNGWYVNMFDKGKAMEIIHEIQGVESFSFHNQWNKFENMPIFHEDLWETKLAELISKYTAEYLTRKAHFKAKGRAMCDNIPENVWQKLQELTKSFDHSYFVLKLANPSNEVKEVKGVARQWIGNRHVLVDFFCDPKNMFYDMRQAKFATYCLLYRILMEGSTCVNCQTRDNLDFYLLCDECSRTARCRHGYFLRTTDEDNKYVNAYKLKMQM